jgi:hypothetical protein
MENQKVADAPQVVALYNRRQLTQTAGPVLEYLTAHGSSASLMFVKESIPAE